MAAQKSNQNPEQWPDGTWHSISWAQHQMNSINAAQGRAAINQTQANTAADLNNANTLKSVAASTPQVAAPPTPPVWAPDSAYNNDVDNNQKIHDTTISQIGEDENKVKYDYGFDDPTNPYSRQAEQKRIALANSNRSNTSMANVGQLTSGAYQRAILRNQHNDEMSAQQLRAQYDAALEDLRRRRTAADQALNTSNSDAYNQSISRSGL